MDFLTEYVKRFVVGAISGAVIGLGFELVGASLDTFVGLAAWWCWFMNNFLMWVQEWLIYGIDSLPGGGWFSLAEVYELYRRLVELDELVPIVLFGQLALTYVSFMIIWLPVRTVLRLIWV